MGYTRGESLVLGYPTEEAVINLLKAKGDLSRRDLRNSLRSRPDLFGAVEGLIESGRIHANRVRAIGSPGNPPLIYSLSAEEAAKAAKEAAKARANARAKAKRKQRQKTAIKTAPEAPEKA